MLHRKRKGFGLGVGGDRDGEIDVLGEPLPRTDGHRHAADQRRFVAERSENLNEIGDAPGPTHGA